MSAVAETQQSRPAVALSIAGSDSCGGAGIQADLRTFAAFGVHGATALTAITAQNTEAVSDVRTLDPPFVAAQVDACLEDLPVAAIKTGMLADADIVTAVADRLETVARRVPLVVDPVMIATAGARLLDQQAVGALVERLLPLATLVTPNLPEAAALTGAKTESDPEALGRRLLETGATAVLVKGGHAAGAVCTDVLVTRSEVASFEWTRAAGAYHGTGCAWAAAVTALLALGHPLDRAVQTAGSWLQQQIRGAFRPERGELGMLPFTAGPD
jgi:hydroxymethylpyrimidine/phosphomethylpyrimidine kinase